MSLVVEVGVYVLRVAGSRDMLRPVPASTVAAVLHKHAQPSCRDILLYPSAWCRL